MTVLIALILWGWLWVVCWPLALGVLAAFPVVWGIYLGIRVVGIVVEGVLGLIREVVLLPGAGGGVSVWGGAAGGVRWGFWI